MIFSEIKFIDKNYSELSLSSEYIRTLKVDGISNVNSNNFKEITLELFLCGNILEARNLVNNFFIKDKTGTLYFALTNGDIRQISCKVNETDFPLNEEDSVAKVTLFSTENFFTDEKTNSISLFSTKKYFEFDDFELTENENLELSYLNKNKSTFIDYIGNIPSGFVLTIHSKAPFSNLKITNDNTGEFIALNREISPNEVILINTNDGEKSAESIDTQTCNVTNVLSDVIFESSFFKLNSGENILSVSGDGNFLFLDISLSYVNKFGGI